MCNKAHTTNVGTDAAPSSSAAKQAAAARGVLCGSLSVFIGFLAASMTFPFLQEQRDLLGCDALCYGSMQSARSGLTLLGSVLVGRLSDTLGRLPPLYLGLTSSLSGYLISLRFASVRGMWAALVPSALLNQNFNVSVLRQLPSASRSLTHISFCRY